MRINEEDKILMKYIINKIQLIEGLSVIKHRSDEIKINCIQRIESTPIRVRVIIPAEDDSTKC